MKILLIDDLRSPRADFKGTHEFSIARNSEEALAILREHPEFDAAFFDHDLGGDDTTRKVATFLREQKFTGNVVPIHEYYIHTANPVGAQWLKAELSDVGLSRRLPVIVPAGDYFTQ